MKHYYLKALMLHSCLLFGITAHAQDFQAKNSDGVTIYYNITSSYSKTCEVTFSGKYSYSVDEYTGNITIPETVVYNGTTYSVTNIGEGAFYSCTGLTSVTIPNSVSYIGSKAFAHCTDLTCIKISESVAAISYMSFYNCTGLSSVTIPNSVTSIGEEAFYSCTGLTSVTIGNSVTSIGQDAFCGCSALTSITIPNSVTSIGEYAFQYCNSLTKIIYNAENCSNGTNFTSLFKGCKNLKYLTIGKSVKRIPSNAFNVSNNLSSILVEQGNSAFDSRDNCNAIIRTESNVLILGCKNTIIPNSVTSIGDNAFAGCTGLTSITIPNSVTSIGSYTFNGCSGLTSVTIPNSVTNIDSDAFSGCTGLCSIKMNATATTQTKMNLDITNNTEYEFYIYSNKRYTTKDNTIEIPELAPGREYSFDYGLRINNRYCRISSPDFTTKSLSQKLETENGDFYIRAKGSYSEGDATILGTMLSFQEKPTEYDNQNEKTFNLDPYTSYTVYYSVNTKEGGVYSASKTFTTGALTWNDEEYQATSTTSARLMTATNCDATEGTGFEWRRYGAPENLKPNAVACPVVDGMLIGSLRNLNSEAYYEFRPYYTSSSGNTYYGEWTALFTGDANVYFEPEVRTYEDVVVTTNNVTLKGYALAGTDDIISQGFEYWKSAVQPASLTASGATMKVEATGITMSTTIGDLEYGTTYCYRAYATTSKGTIYGDTVEFTTEKDLSGVESVIAEEDETIEYYNLQGVRVVNPERGLYIKRQGGKTSKVVL